MDSSQAYKRIPLLVWGLALIPRLFTLILVLRHPAGCVMSDSMSYINLASNMIHRHQFIQTQGLIDTIETFRTPGYPLFLIPFVTLFQSPVIPIAVAQILLGFCSVLLTWVIFTKLSPGQGALIGTAFLALDWGIVIHTPMVLTEALTTLLLLLDIAVTFNTIKRSTPLRAAGCGFLWSVTAFVKPLVLYLPLLLAWLWARNKKCFAAFLIAAYLLPSFWILRNWRVAQFPGFSSVGGMSMRLYPAVGIIQLQTGRSWVESDAILRQGFEQQHPNLQNNQAGLSMAYAAIAIPIIKAHPFLFIRVNLLGAFRILSGLGMEMFYRFTENLTIPTAKTDINITGQNTSALLKMHPALLIFFIPYLIMLGLLYGFFSLGILKLWQAGKRCIAYFLFCCPLYFLALSAHQGYQRFRIPMIPFLAAGAAAFFIPQKGLSDPSSHPAGYQKK